MLESELREGRRKEKEIRQEEKDRKGSHTHVIFDSAALAGRKRHNRTVETYGRNLRLRGVKLFSKQRARTLSSVESAGSRAKSSTGDGG